MVGKEPLFPSDFRGQARLQLLRWHRLEEFYKVFEMYLAGHASAQAVKTRWRKLHEVGMPFKIQ